jgi:polynucleotide 5'-hydroxyl-kinase GRC3/NOL9
MPTVPAPGWEELLQLLLSRKGTALFIGRSDSGKSSLVKYLLHATVSAGLPAALIDADLGQSWLGLPGCVSLRTFQEPPPRHQICWDQLSFLGAITPVRVMSLLAEETGRMAQRAREQAAITLIDTTGLVDGDIGRVLKLAKIRAVAPDLVVAVTAGDELEHILSQVSGPEIVRIAPSPLVKRRSAEVRYRYRHARLAVYLHGAREQLLPTRHMTFMRLGRSVDPAFAPPEPGTVVGLNHAAETRAIGVVSESDADSLVVLTPVDSIRGIDRVVIGEFSYVAEQSRPPWQDQPDSVSSEEATEAEDAGAGPQGEGQGGGGSMLSGSGR